LLQAIRTHKKTVLNDAIEAEMMQEKRNSETTTASDRHEDQQSLNDALTETDSIDYQYLRPSLLKQVHNLLTQEFWPKIDGNFFKRAYHLYR
jgi:hypothetical protein